MLDLQTPEPYAYPSDPRPVDDQAREWPMLDVDDAPEDDDAGLIVDVTFDFPLAGNGRIAFSAYNVTVAGLTHEEFGTLSETIVEIIAVRKAVPGQRVSRQAVVTA